MEVRPYLSHCAINVWLVAVDLSAREAPAGMGLVPTDEQALVHGGVQEDGPHAWHRQLVSHKPLEDVCEQVAVLLEAATLLEDEACELLEGQGLEVCMLLSPMVLRPHHNHISNLPCGYKELEHHFIPERTRSVAE